MGADGITLPHIENLDQARQAVSLFADARANVFSAAHPEGNAVAMLFHNLYFLAQALHWSNRAVMLLMLVAYCTYLINCAQFVFKGIQTGRQRRRLILDS